MWKATPTLFMILNTYFITLKNDPSPWLWSIFEAFDISMLALPYHISPYAIISYFIVELLTEDD